MARIINNAFPTINSGSAALGFSFPLSGRAVFNSTYTTKDVVKTNLINYFLTNPGERPGNPEFGGGLRAFIFSQIEEDNLEYLKEAAKLLTEEGELISNV